MVELKLTKIVRPFNFKLINDFVFCLVVVMLPYGDVTFSVFHTTLLGSKFAQSNVKKGSINELTKALYQCR